MMGTKAMELFVICGVLFISTANCDISEYFQKLKSDAEMDFFQKMPPQKLVMESRSPPDLDFSDYYDYFGIEPTISNAVGEGEEDDLNVADDILSSVKTPTNQFNRKSLKTKEATRYPYKKRNSLRHHKDNIAVASSPKATIMTKRVSRPKVPAKRISYQFNKPSATKHTQRLTGNDIVSKVQRLVPSKLKTVIEGGGKKIVKTVLQPVQKITKDIKHQIDRKQEIAEKEDQSWFAPYRTYLSGIAPVFHNDYITKQLVAVWVQALASSVVW